MSEDDPPPSKKFKQKLAAASSSTSTSVSLAESSPIGPSMSFSSVALSSDSVAPCSSVTSGPAPLENDVYSPHAIPDLSPTPSPAPSWAPDIVTPVSATCRTEKCNNCAKTNQKRRSLLKKHNRLRKRFSKLEAAFNQLQNAQVLIFCCCIE